MSVAHQEAGRADVPMIAKNSTTPMMTPAFSPFVKWSLRSRVATGGAVSMPTVHAVGLALKLRTTFAPRRAWAPGTRVVVRRSVCVAITKKVEKP